MNFMAFSIVSFLAISSATAAFEDWIGSWNGSCELRANNGVKNFDVSLKIEPKEKSIDYKWQIIYEANGEMAREVRNYDLLTIDAKSGHYVVDEKNGLFLDSYLSGSLLYSPFTISGKLVTVTYNLLSADKMLVDMPMFEDTPVRKTCTSWNSNLCASSFALSSVQHCILTK